MNSRYPIVTFYLFLAWSMLIIGYRPERVSDQNAFFKEFINHEYINVLGVILAITPTSLTQIHFSLNSFE